MKQVFQSNVEIQKASDELPKVLDSLAYAELPMPVICAMTTYFKIDIKDVRTTGNNQSATKVFR